MSSNKTNEANKPNTDNSENNTYRLNDKQMKAIKIWVTILIVITISGFLYGFVTGLYVVSALLLVAFMLPRLIHAYEEQREQRE